MTYYNCDGRGRCLVETFDDKTIFVKNCDFYCKYTCTPSPCANYLFCEHLVPNYILRSTKGLCTQCSYSFGHLVFSECPECPECPDPQCYALVNCDGGVINTWQNLSTYVSQYVTLVGYTGTFFVYENDGLIVVISVGFINISSSPEL